MATIDFNGNTQPLPTTGANISVPYSSNISSTSYADVSHLSNLLDQLNNALSSLVLDLETQLVGFALVVTKDNEDIKLKEAVAAEWPTSLGAPLDRVSYRYYKYLEQRDTRSAQFIRKKFEEAARGVCGSTALDVLILTKVLINEYHLVQEFISSYVDDLTDAAEHRAVEHIQDWAESALNHVGRLRSVFQKEESSRKLPDADVDGVSSEDARNAQALFQVNLNKLNIDVLYNLDYINKNLVSHASIFYNNHLGPALQFRKKITSKIVPVIPGRIGKEVTASKASSDKHLVNLLSDQLRRNNLFEDKFTEAETHIQMRDYYRTYIWQLALKGSPVSTTSSGSFFAIVEDSQQASFFELNAGVNLATPNFEAPHGYLSRVDEPAAHPQYVLKSGDIFSGDINLAQGVKVDNIVPHEHSHTGKDGSVQVHGDDIIPGSLTTTSVNRSDLPIAPTGLHVISQKVNIIPPGAAKVDVVIGWNSDDGNTFEVNIAPVV